MASKDPKIRAIEIEAANRAKADGKTSHKERFQIRNELRAAQGLGAEKKKRGGLAGTWDRNKHVIKPVVAGAAGLLTGGVALPALLGAGMGGLDRPGKGGVGFDLGGAVKGGLTGAAAGYGGKLLGSAAYAAKGAADAGLSPLWGAGQSLKSSGAGRLLGKVAGAGKEMVLGAVTKPDGSIDGGRILKGAMGAVPIVQGMQAQSEANRRSAATAAQSDAANDSILELARMLMLRNQNGGGGGDLSFLRDNQNPYTSQFRPSLAPPRM
jgi:hypothetical protein